MKRFILMLASMLVLWYAPHAAAGDCISELTARRPVPELPLPPACRAMGPISLGMTTNQVIAAMGTPDTQAIPAVTVLDFVYVFPRDLAARLQRHPLPEFKINYGYMVVAFRNNVVVTISATVASAPIFPYSMGGIAIGEPVNKLLNRLPMNLGWNTSHDYIGLYPYRIGIDVRPFAGTISGIYITDATRPVPGHPVRVMFVQDLNTGLVNGYSITVGPSIHSTANH